MRKLPIYLSLLLLLTCAKEDNTSLIEGYQLQISQLNSKATEYSNQVSQLQSTVNSLNNQVNTIPGLENTITSLNEQIGELEDTIATLTSEVSTIPDLNDEITTLEETIASLNEQIEELEIIFSYKPPPVYYQTSIQNHEWNDGWYNNNTHHVDYGGTSPSHFRRGFTYFDYEGDGDMDVFACVPHFENNNIDEVHLEYQILVNNGSIDGIVQWEVKKDIIVNQLPYYASIIQPVDIDSDNDMDIVIFVADDPNNYNSGETAGGGIFVYVYDNGKYTYHTIEPYRNQIDYLVNGEIPYWDGYFHGGTAGDINGDGLIDLVAGTDRIQYWINNGNLNFTRLVSTKLATNIPEEDFPSFLSDFYAFGGSGVFICNEFLFDINQDGYLDLLVAVPNDKVYNPNHIGYKDLDEEEKQELYKENMRIHFGKPEFPYFNNIPDLFLETHLKLSYENQYACAFDISIIDFDNDGDYDIFTQSYPNNPLRGTLLSYYENENNLNFINKTTQIFQGDEYIGATCSSGFFKVTDADNDGDYDIIRETGQPRASSECMNINGWINSNGILSKYRF